MSYPDYPGTARRLTHKYSRLGVFGGRSLPDFETSSASWLVEISDLLTLRDLGLATQIAASRYPLRSYPRCAPLGAGMALRREAVPRWLAAPCHALGDQRGAELTSADDNDMPLTLFSDDWDVAYFPAFSMHHPMLAKRAQPGYPVRLNWGIQKYWAQWLRAHGISLWGSKPARHLLARNLKAWLPFLAWSSSETPIWWQCAGARFEGLAQ